RGSDRGEQEVAVGHPDPQREKQIHHGSKRQQEERDPERGGGNPPAQVEEARGKQKRRDDPREGDRADGLPRDRVERRELDRKERAADVERQDLRQQGTASYPGHRRLDERAVPVLGVNRQQDRRDGQREERQLVQDPAAGEAVGKAEVVGQERRREDDGVALREHRGS